MVSNRGLDMLHPILLRPCTCTTPEVKVGNPSSLRHRLVHVRVGK